MTVWEFMGGSPWLTFFLALILAHFLAWPFRLCEPLDTSFEYQGAGLANGTVDGCRRRYSPPSKEG